MTQIRPERAARHNLPPIGFWLDTLAADMSPWPFPSPGTYLSVSYGPGGGDFFVVNATEEVDEDTASIERAVRACFSRSSDEPLIIGESCSIELAGRLRPVLGFNTGQGDWRLGQFGAVLPTSEGSLLVTFGIRLGKLGAVVCADLVAPGGLGTLIRTFTITSPAPGAGPAVEPGYVPSPDRLVCTREQLLALSPESLIGFVCSLPWSRPERRIAAFACVVQFRAATGMPRVSRETLHACVDALSDAMARVSGQTCVSPVALALVDQTLGTHAAGIPIFGRWLEALRLRLRTRDITVEVLDRVNRFLSAVNQIFVYEDDEIEVALSRGFPR